MDERIGGRYGEVVLEAVGVEKSYGEIRALAGIDLTVARGEIVALLGRNGAGKTTLFSIAAGLLRPDRGRVTVDGTDVVARPEGVGRSIGFAPQTIGVYPSLTLMENLEFFGRLGGLRGSALGRSIAAAVDALDLGPLLHRRVRYLTGGQQRLAHVAGAVLHRPALLLLDEPSAGLDLAGRDRLIHLLSDYAGAGGAVCYSTHVLGDVAALGATLAVIDRGGLVARGPLDQLLAEHGRSYLVLRFDGPPPERVCAIPGARVDGSSARIPCDDLGAAAATVIGGLGAETGRLTSLDMIHPSLESVFFSITGRAISGTSEEVGTDVAMVAAP